MAMALNGLAKLSEELGELQQIIGKLQAFPDGAHPDGKGSLFTRLEEETADVLAAIEFVKMKHNLSNKNILSRMSNKLMLFFKWNDES